MQYNVISIYMVHIYHLYASMLSQKAEVLTFLNTLPRNKVTTYKALAEKFKTHPRAIATYMRTNKEYDLYPCYKVVAADGWLSGYILWVPEKQKRLERDWVHIINNKVLATYIITHF